jgi:hypothetical protein
VARGGSDSLPAQKPPANGHAKPLIQRFRSRDLDPAHNQMISCGSVSRPVNSFSTSRLNCSFGISRALCNQVAQSKCLPSARATVASSNPFVQPTSFRSLLAWQVLVDGHQVVRLFRFWKPPLQPYAYRKRVLVTLEDNPIWSAKAKNPESTGQTFRSKLLVP